MIRLLLHITALIVFTTSFATAQKVGVIDIPRIIKESKKAQASSEGTKKLAEEQNESLAPKMKEFNEKRKAITERFKGKPVEELRNDEDFKAANAELQKLGAEVQKLQAAANKAVQERSMEEFEKFRSKVDPIVKNIAEEKGLEIVLSAGIRSPIVYFSEKIDITREVIEQYDAAAE